MQLDSPPRATRLDINVLDLDTPMQIQPRIRYRNNIDQSPGTFDMDAYRKRRKFDTDPELPDFIPDTPKIMDVKLDSDVSLLQNLLDQMELLQHDETFGVVDTPGGIRERQLPWGHIIFNDSFTGPGNDMGPYSKAVAEGELSKASWEHDWLVSNAQGNTDLLQQIDKRYLEQVQSMDIDPMLKYFITESIKYGAPIYYKLREWFNL